MFTYNVLILLIQNLIVYYIFFNMSARFLDNNNFNYSNTNITTYHDNDVCIQIAQKV